MNKLNSKYGERKRKRSDDEWWSVASSWREKPAASKLL